MALIRFTPNRELLSMQDEVNRLFDSVMGRSARPDGNGWLPPVDIQETDDGFTVRMDLPGVQPKDVKINMTGDTLSVRGERRCERDENNTAWQRTECAYGTFERVFTLGTPVDSNAVKATYRDGVLELRLPKAAEAK